MTSSGARSVFVMASLFQLVSCAVGPDFKKPMPAVPQTWSVTQSAASVPDVSASPSVAWWTEFQDPTLTSLITRAARTNLDVRQAVLRIAEARAQRNVTSSGLWPSLSANASYERQRLSENTQNGALLHSVGAVPGAATLANPYDQYQLGFDASWEIDLFGRVRRSIEAADANTQMSVEDAHDAVLSMMAEVARTYTELRGAQSRLTVTQDTLRIQRELLQLTQQRREVGLTNDLDVQNAATLVATTEAQIPQFERSITQDLNQLSRLLGQFPGSLQSELVAPVVIPPAPPRVPVGLPAELARRRPDVRRAEAQVHAATAKIGVATADLFPRLSLSAGAGFQSEDSAQLTDWSSRFFRVGPTLQLPIFVGERWATLKLQDVRAQESANDYERVVLAALHEVENAWVAYTQEQKRRDSLLEAVAHAEQVVQLAEQRYRSGIATFIDVLDAERSLQQNKLQWIESTTAVSTNLIVLYKALGGGWEQVPLSAKGSG